MSSDAFEKTAISPGSKHYIDFNVELFAELNDQWKDNPMKSMTEVRPSKENVVEHKNFHTKYASDKVEMLARLFNWDMDPPKRILEFGCGTGFIAQYIKQTYPDAEVVCTEIYTDKKWVEYPEITFHEVDISKEDIEFMGTFDYIVSFVVFEHVRHPYGALSALFRLLEPGGKLFFSSCLDRGWSASHRYREVFFPWPHLLFQDSVFAEYYEKYLGRSPSAANITSWVNGMTPAHYREYFRKIGFDVNYLRLSGGKAEKWGPEIEEFYQRFFSVLGKYSKEDLKSAMMQVALSKPEGGASDSMAIYRETSKISWEPVEDATSYRLIFWNDATGSELKTIVVDSAEHHFDWSDIEIDHYLRCRIQHRIGNGEWEKTTTYFPICAPPASYRSQVDLCRGTEVISWEPVEGAHSYRFLIRNDSLETITDKVVTTDTEYVLDWDARSTERQRYRVQHRLSEGEEWIDGDSYVYLTPPPLKPFSAKPVESSKSGIIRNLFGRR